MNKVSPEKGVTKIHVYAYAGRDIKAGMTIATYSTKLRALVDQKRDIVFYTSLKDIMGKIKKDIPTETI